MAAFDDGSSLPAPLRGGPGAKLAGRYSRVRDATERLVGGLSAEDLVAQSMPDASPAKWHLAHTTWFFETFLLAPSLAGYAVFDPAYAFLFNSYYEALGPRQPRPQRGLLTRPSLEQVLAYRAHVDAAMAELLAGDADVADLVELGLAHEEQHQELILMDLLHLFAQSPLKPAYGRDAPQSVAPDPGPASPVDFQGGLVEIGHASRGFAFDNEGPRHKVYLQPYRLADRLVTNEEWLAFMEDGGYRRAELWLADGWARVQAEGWEAPFYWERPKPGEGGWLSMTLQGLRPLDPHAPVAHVSFFEADAYASWAGARLPTEAEWEHAAQSLPVRGNFAGRGRLSPAGADPNGQGLRQMFGDLWEWTRSAYSPYPGFKPAAGAVGEYNGKFMIGQMVLRGGACVTPEGHARASYRNFFHPEQRWMFSGVRLAWDGDPKLVAAPRPGTFGADVIEGLSRPRKALQAKYFYDAEGSRLFEEICDLPEYYPTRTETALLREKAAEMAAVISDDAALVEFGSGASSKTRILLDAAPQLGAYVPIDISPDALDAAAESIRRDYPRLEVAPMVDDFTTALHLPEAATGRPRTGFFPGSTIGNFRPEEAVAFLKTARQLLGRGAAFLIGLDVVKAPMVMVAAYDDEQGVTAAFNLNLLTRINRELDGDFDLDAFEHRAVWNPEESRMEMHLVSRKDQVARAAGRSFHFAAGETIHTENSYKFTIEGFEALAVQAGWILERSWVSPAPSFAIVRLLAV
jgi:dimethylhistidine N-methyltransferase